MSRSRAGYRAPPGAANGVLSVATSSDVVPAHSHNQAVASYDQEVLDAIFARAGQVKDPSRRNRYLRAALQTGLVESGLRNLNYGDADSQGWRQERSSLYKDPMNVSASVDRFFREAEQFDRGQPSWELAADVQRPAAQYRGRYKDVARQAAALLGDSRRSGSGTTSEPGAVGSTASGTNPGIDLPGGPADFTSLLSSLMSRPQPQPAQAAPIQAPAFSAAPALPQGFKALTPDPVQATSQERPVSQALGLLETLRGPEPTSGPSGGNEPANGPIFETVMGQRDQPGRVKLPKSGKNPWGVLDNVGRSGRYLQQKFEIKDIGGYRAKDPFPDHPSRKALDLMVYDDTAKGDAIAEELTRNYKQHGIKYLIWKQRIWHPGEGWRKMEDRGSPTQNHMDHVHALYE